jgi:hypothetical protein
MPEPLDVLVQPGPVESLARLGVARRLAADRRRGRGAFRALGLALLLASAYGAGAGAGPSHGGGRARRPALLAGAASLVAYRAYGITADTRAVVVWRTGILRSDPHRGRRLPEDDALPAGSTAIADKAFLGWIRLSFPNGQTGWVLRSEAVYLWRSPPG